MFIHKTPQKLDKKLLGCSLFFFEEIKIQTYLCSQLSAEL